MKFTDEVKRKQGFTAQAPEFLYNFRNIYIFSAFHARATGNSYS